MTAYVSQIITDFSLAPMYLFKISGPLTLIKLRPHSLATAEARRVFPQPGNPYSNKLWIGVSLAKPRTMIGKKRSYPDRKRNGD